jgi:hypothetical protein
MNHSPSEVHTGTQGSLPIGRAIAVRILISALLSLCVAACGNSKRPDFCVAQKRYLTDEEFIGIAIRNQVYADRLGIGASEESVSNFHMNHPKCCRVTASRQRHRC